MVFFSRSSEFYDAIYAARGKDYAAEVVYLEQFLPDSGGEQPRRILDVACGTGEHMRWMQHWGVVSGVDLDPAMLAVARRKLPGIRFTRGDMSCLDMGDSYDVLTCLFGSIGYLESVDALTASIRCMARHLRPGGILLLEPPLDRRHLRLPERIATTIVIGDARITRVAHATIDGDVLQISFHYTVHRGDDRLVFEEEHPIQILDMETYAAALSASGLDATFDATGPSGKGLWIGHSRAGTRDGATSCRTAIKTLA